MFVFLNLFYEYRTKFYLPQILEAPDNLSALPTLVLHLHQHL